MPTTLSTMGEMENELLAKTEVSVLVVDDDTRNLLAIESILDSEAYTLVKAQTGDEALMALMQREFAVMVLDVQMPGLSGIELARLVKQRKRTQHLPIIFLTAHYREDEHAVLGYDVGAVDYLTKPVHPGVLRSKVNVFVDLFRKTHALAEMNRTMRKADEALRAANAELEARNVALEREAEERLRRIQAESAQAEAEEANAAKDRFLAMLSHELRTPLSPIIHTLSLLDEGECPASVRDGLDVIRRNVRLEARLIDDLLDLARIRNGKLRMEVQAVDLHEVLHHAIEICRSEFDAREIRLVEEFRATRVRVEGDSARLQQVFWNLLTNAAKFTPAGGTVTVETLDGDGADEIDVRIHDTGAGIPADKLSRIFDAFEQGVRQSSAGLGLGLAICRALVELHKGRISASSGGASQGSTFAVHMPRSEVVVAKVVEPRKPAPEKGGLKILLVEDHRDTLRTLEQLLQRRGYEVRTAMSVEQGLAAASEFPFDLLVSDIGLPDGRGTDLLEALNASRGEPVRAIAMSGFGMEEDLARSRAAGFAEHLTKPVEFSALREAISRLSAAT